MAVALVFVVNERAGDYLRREPFNRGYWVIDTKWALLEGLEEPVDTLVLGDSSCHQGVVPSLLRERWGGRALNLCTTGTQIALDDAWMLGRYVARFGAPERVIVVHADDVWHRHVNRRRLMRVPLGWGFWDEVEPPLKPTGRERWDYVLHHYLPLYAQNRTLGKLALKPWKDYRLDYERDEDGYMAVTHADPTNVAKDTRGHLRALRKGWKQVLSRANREALECMGSLADEAGFELYVASAPVHDRLGRSDLFSKRRKDIDAALDPIVGRHPHMHRVLREPPRFPKSRMQNSDHVTDEAARVYTAALAEAVDAVAEPLSSRR